MKQASSPKKPHSKDSEESGVQSSDSAKVAKGDELKNESISRSKAKTKSTHSISVNQLLGDLLAGRNITLLSSKVELLPKETQEVIAELLRGFIEPTLEPKPKFKWELFSNKQLRELSARLPNPNFAFTMVVADLPKEVKYKALSSFIGTEFNSVKVDFALKKLESAASVSRANEILETFIENDKLASSQWAVFQWRVLIWAVTAKASPSLISEALQTWTPVVGHLKSVEPAIYKRFAKSLLTHDISAFCDFMIFIGFASINLKTLEEYLHNQADSFILTYLHREKSLISKVKHEFESQFLAPLLVKRINAIMNMELLIPYLARYEAVSQLIEPDLLIRAVKRVYHSKSDLVMLLQDPRIAKFERDLETLKDSLVSKDLEIGSLFSTLEAARNDLSGATAAVKRYEIQLRSALQTEDAGRQASVRQVKIDLWKDLIENLDKLFSTDAGFALGKVLEKSGISRIGEAGETFQWDQSLCESISGGEMSAGIVVRTGYTWLEGNELTVLRRILLKPIS